MCKNKLRQLIIEKIRQFTYEQLSELSLPIIARLLSNPRVLTAKTILMYYSLPSEVNTYKAIKTLQTQGKTILLPVVTSDDNMELHIYKGVESMHVGVFGIMEPTGELYTDYNEIDIAVIPGIAFDGDNNRIGRGKGYYDRLLPKLTNAYKFGLCFDFQYVRSVPTDIHDIKMNEIITKNMV